MRQLLADIKARRSLRRSFAAWWARERSGMLAGVAVVLVLWLGYQQIQLWQVTGRERANRISNTQVMCRSIKELVDYDKHFVEQFHVIYTGPTPVACAPLVAKARAAGGP